MFRRFLLAALLGMASVAFLPSGTAMAEPHVPCYPDFGGGTVCVIGEEPQPCFVLVSYNPNRYHPQWPAHVSPVYCRDGDDRQQMTPCLPGYLPLDPYCWTDYPDEWTYDPVCRVADFLTLGASCPTDDPEDP